MVLLITSFGAEAATELSGTATPSTAAQRIGTATLTQSYCALDSERVQATAGRVAIAVHNETELPNQFGRQRIGEGHTFNELSKATDASRQIAEEGKPVIDHSAKSWQAPAAPIITETQIGLVQLGMYGISCI